MRRYTSESSPARTAPVTGAGAGSTPTPAARSLSKAVTDRRPTKNVYPVTTENTTNVDGSHAAPTMPYGVQVGRDRDDIVTSMTYLGKK
jgi:hypothetical protein